MRRDKRTSRHVRQKGSHNSGPQIKDSRDSLHHNHIAPQDRRYQVKLPHSLWQSSNRQSDPSFRNLPVPSTPPHIAQSTVQSQLHSRFPPIVSVFLVGNFMQPGLIDTPNNVFQPTNSHLPHPTAAQHGPGRSRSSLPGARSPLRARSTSPGDPSLHGRTPAAPGLSSLDSASLAQALGELRVVEATPAAAAPQPATVAGQRIVDYENAVIVSSPRHDYRPPLGFKVIPNSRSDGVQLLDFPNGSSLPRLAPLLLRPQPQGTVD